MQAECVGKYQTPDGDVHLASPTTDGGALLLSSPKAGQPRRRLDTLLYGESPKTDLAEMIKAAKTVVRDGKWISPVCDQEVWAAGVTYLRSSEARQQESKGAAVFYDKVYSAPRPELFFKATPRRVIGNGGEVAIRQDSKWSVPEPEVTLVVSPSGRIVGHTIGNDMSSRDIEGENPLYLPQAKVYSRSCALGPWIRLGLPEPSAVISVRIDGPKGEILFEGKTTWGRMRRPPEELVGWLFRENDFPQGAFLMTGTGVVPPDDFSLQGGETVSISIDSVGVLNNLVIRGHGI